VITILSQVTWAVFSCVHKVMETSAPFLMCGDGFNFKLAFALDKVRWWSWEINAMGISFKITS